MLSPPHGYGNLRGLQLCSLILTLHRRWVTIIICSVVAWLCSELSCYHLRDLRAIAPEWKSIFIRFTHSFRGTVFPAMRILEALWESSRSRFWDWSRWRVLGTSLSRSLSKFDSIANVLKIFCFIRVARCIYTVIWIWTTRCIICSTIEGI